ncbi:hypothetical protein LCGC14_1791020 [marine sediment metagenome]|uniref:Uncharacterized protein n=1 Tax=marine sediment metagenome TaxID=412755 RepID=A0A0F9JS71_9ZZZZ
MPLKDTIRQLLGKNSPPPAPCNSYLRVFRSGGTTWGVTDLLITKSKDFPLIVTYRITNIGDKPSKVIARSLIKDQFGVREHGGEVRTTVLYPKGSCEVHCNFKPPQGSIPTTFLLKSEGHLRTFLRIPFKDIPHKEEA